LQFALHYFVLFKKVLPSKKQVTTIQHAYI